MTCIAEPRDVFTTSDCSCAWTAAFCNPPGLTEWGPSTGLSVVVDSRE